MALTFHPLKVKKVSRETSDCISVLFDVPEDLKPSFAFKQGQNLTLRKSFNGEEVRRTYSICASPLDGELRVAIKKIPEGVFSTYLNDDLRPGDTLDVMPPQGRFFTEAHPSQTKVYVAFAAGSGITPILSIVKTILRTEPGSRFCLVYGNRTRGSIIFKAELEALKNRFMDRLSIYHILSREKADAEILSGRIDAAKCKFFLDKIIAPQTIDECFLCGPEAMIHDVRDVLLQAGVEPRKIHYELFYSAAANQQRQAVKPVVVNDQQSTVTVTLDGTAVQMVMGYHGESVLEAALRNGADLPFACKGGVCATCRARLTEGKVEMDINYALEQDELDAGFILTCQAHPRTPDVAVNFDIK